MWLYKAENGEKIVIREENLCSAVEREGFELLGECDAKGKLTKKAETAQTEQTE